MVVSPKNNSLNPTIIKNTIPFQSIDNLVNLIDRTAVNCYWEQSLPCPCINPQTNQPRMNCPHCLGKGVIFRKPRLIAIALQSNEKKPYSGSMGEVTLGTTIGTPQPTENRIEEGISFRDRISPVGITLNQTYVVNITQDRFDKGVIIPYNVDKFNTMLYEDDLGQLQYLEIGGSLSYDSKTSVLKVNDPKLLNKNITMSMSVAIRYYVVDIEKEVRFADVKKTKFQKILNGETEGTNVNNETKETMTKFNTISTDENQGSPNGYPLYRLPKKLVLRREDLYIPMSAFDAPDVSDSSSKTVEGMPSVIDTKLYASPINDVSSMFES